MVFDTKILGTSSATPTINRNPSAQVVNLNEQLFLVDCGEATQMQMTKYHIRQGRINHICISHLHGDHYFGLIGLINSMNLQGRTDDLNLFAPPDISEVITTQMRVSNSQLNFKINLFSTFPAQHQIVYENDFMQIETIPLSHKIECCGFLFREKKRARKIDVKKIDMKTLSFEAIRDLKKGKDVVDLSGKQIPNATVTVLPPDPKSFAYCSDTCYDEKIVDYIQGVDLLYHEATFLHDLLPRAISTFHSTATQAATQAKNAGVKKLIIGHYSSRYKDLTLFTDEARQIFENTYLAIEGDTHVVE